MGNTKQSSSGTSTQTSTPQETEYSKQTTPLDVELRKAVQPGLIGTQTQGLDLAQRLLSGQSLPGYLNTLPGGISPEVTNSIVNQSLNDLNVQLAKSGAGTFLESGASQAIGARSAADIRNQAEQFNLNNLLQLLNIGIGGQAQVQAPISAFNANLTNRLQGLTPMSQTGNSSQFGKTQYSFFTSPFTTSLAGGFGQGLGGAVGGKG